MRTITPEQGDALDAFLALDRHLWYDVAPSFSCIEIDTVCALLAAFGTDPDVIADVLASHAEADDAGDSHYTGPVTA